MRAISTGTRAPLLERVFTRSIAAGLGVAMPSVAVGEAVYPIMTSGGSASMLAKDGAKDAEAAAFTGQTLSPGTLDGALPFPGRRYGSLPRT